MQLAKYHWKKNRLLTPCTMCGFGHPAIDCPHFTKNGRRRTEHEQRQQSDSVFNNPQSHIAAPNPNL